ncbi:MAG: DNA mismatch repair endonuclease MutL [Deltaproteobacteria bacterium]|nr:DNA mismatch repair endonuclease MutL [Deltaproteobacteria bacterium]
MARPPRIAKLPSALIDQIAAGEVVERAASVVKELCENSLDAGARRIDVELTAGGRTAIRIVDDGFGMTAEEARLALERHATSKIKQESDLWGVETFGFRGEALPSIASVSRLTLQTRPPDAQEGFLLRVEAGQETDARACGMPQGTQIEVRDLFFNTPARLKFQKTEATETSNVSEALLRLAVANPDVHFRLRANGRVLLDLPPHRDLSERVRAALAKRGAGVLHEAVGDENGVAVHAFLAEPACAASTTRNTFMFVGRRFVRDRSLLQALSMGYGELIEKGRYPLAVLFVDVAGEDLDVNVHPQKMEVRFAQPQPVYAAVRHVVQSSIATAPWAASATARPYSFPPSTHSKASARAAEHAPPRHVPARAPSLTDAPVANLDQVFKVYPLPALPPSNAPLGSLGTLPFVGVFARRYMLLEEPGVGLLMIDGEAAGHAILLAKLQRALLGGPLAAQRLLFPIPVSVDAVAAAWVGRSPAALAPLGFDVEVFGSESILVRAVPELLSHSDPKPLLSAALSALLAGQQPTFALANMVACAPVVRLLNERDAQTLLQQLDTLGVNAQAFVARLGIDELAGRFGRS